MTYLSTAPTGPRRPSRRRRLVGLLAAATTVIGLTVAASSGMGAAATGPVVRATTTAIPLHMHVGSDAGVIPENAAEPLDCPGPTYPTSATSTASYGIPFSAAFDNIHVNAGYNEATGQWLGTMSGITGTACGLIELPSFKAVIQPNDIYFNTGHAQIVVQSAYGNLTPYVELTLKAVGPIVATITGIDPNGNIEATGSATINALIKAYPEKGGSLSFTCSQTLSASVSTTTAPSTVVPAGHPANGPWTVQSTPLTGPIQAAQATVANNDTALPPFAMPSDWVKDNGDFSKYKCWIADTMNCVLSGAYKDPTSPLGYSFYMSHEGGCSLYDPPPVAATPAGEVQTFITVHLADIPCSSGLDDAPAYLGSGYCGAIDLPEYGTAFAAASSYPSLASYNALPAGCKPTHLDGPPYQVPVAGTFAANVALFGGKVTTTGTAGSFCALGGLLPASEVPGSTGAAVCAGASITSNSLQFSKLAVQLHLLPDTTTDISNIGVKVQPVVAGICNNAAPGPLTVKTNVTTSVSANLFGAQCGLTVTVPTEATVSGNVSPAAGDPVSPNLNLKALPFAVPAPTPGPLCPESLVQAASKVLPIPAPAGSATFNLSVDPVLALPNIANSARFVVPQAPPGTH